MSSTLEGAALDLIKDKNFATLSTLRKDGTIQSVVIWADADDAGRVVLNSAEGRAWPANLRRTGHGTVTVVNRENPMEFVSVTGDLDVDTTEDGEAVINQLANKYMGTDYPWLGNDTRVTFRLAPKRVTYVKQG
ncbi:MAG: class F420-dependent oxidoreductase [Solirubrobacterales bacterium]|jgi:PPOX class probable F420-dependent enzyme|nr:class F420-dependent oxidoreductase [Solirubrobacterales bacterium]